MQYRRGTGRDRRSTDVPPQRRPRVVILEAEGDAGVEILELEEDVEVGVSFRHRGRLWTVTGERRGSRVLYATPAMV